MMNINPIYWMTIFSIITLFLVFVLYELAMLLRESRASVTKVNAMADELSIVVTKARSLVDAGEILLNTILSPMKYLNVIATFIEELFKKTSNENKSVDIEVDEKTKVSKAK